MDLHMAKICTGSTPQGRSLAFSFGYKLSCESSVARNQMKKCGHCMLLWSGSRIKAWFGGFGALAFGFKDAC